LWVLELSNTCSFKEKEKKIFSKYKMGCCCAERPSEGDQEIMIKLYHKKCSEYKKLKKINEEQVALDRYVFDFNGQSDDVRKRVDEVRDTIVDIIFLFRKFNISFKLNEH
jgi:hypothetical protein